MIWKYLSVYTDTVCHLYTKTGMTYTNLDSTELRLTLKRCDTAKHVSTD